MYFFDFRGVPKPRMVASDKWRRRPIVLKYFRYKDELLLASKKQRFVALNCGYHLIFMFEPPRSLSKKKREAMFFTPHQARPDKDNLEKGFLDALHLNDEAVWDGRTTKIWGPMDCIFCIDSGAPDLKQIIDLCVKKMG